MSIEEASTTIVVLLTIIGGPAYLTWLIMRAVRRTARSAPGRSGSPHPE
jgi:hypothetical protein